MKYRMMARALSFLLAASPLLADASYTRTNTVKPPMDMARMSASPMGGLMKAMGGGEMMKAFEPTVDRIMVHGNRMVTVTSHGTTIMDLDKQEWIQTETAKREYSVMTFQQMADMTERFLKSDNPMVAAMAGRGPAPGAQQPETETTVDIKEENPGTTRDVAGYTATEHIFTAKITTKYKDPAMQAKIDQTPGAAGMMSVVYTEEVWTLSEYPPAYQAILDFERRMGEKMSRTMSPAARVALPSGMPNSPGAANGMMELQRRVAALPGLHVIQVTKMSMPINLAAIAAAEGQPAAAAVTSSNSGGQTPSSASTSSTATSVAQGAATSGTQAAISKLGGIGGAMAKGGLGGFGGFGGRKQAAPAAAPAPATAAPAATAQAAPANGAAGLPIFSETVMELGNFSLQPVSTSEFEVPSGYKQVPSPMEKFLKQPGR
jgi:hypothetical protein